MRSAAEKLQHARTQLLLQRPFLGALALHLPLVAAESGQCLRMACDAKRIYYNLDYVNAAHASELQFMLAHQVLHCALQHFMRRRRRVRALWDAACDFAVNQLLAADGLTPPQGALLDARYRGLAAEEIYPLLNTSFVEPTIDAHWYEGTAPRLRVALNSSSLPSSSEEAWQDAQANLHDPMHDAQLWQQRLIGAAQQARAAGRLSLVWRQAFDAHVRPALPWRVLLARYLSAHARHDYSFERLSRRSTDSVLLPSLSQPLAQVIVALDTSGSVSEGEMQIFIDEIDALKGQLRAHVTVHACDQRLAPNGPWEFPLWQPLRLPEDLGGGGGTRFTPIFEWIDQVRARPDCLIYFTDACGEFPHAAPNYPVLWLVRGNAGVPWGERVQLD